VWFAARAARGHVRPASGGRPVRTRRSGEVAVSTRPAVSGAERAHATRSTTTLNRFRATLAEHTRAARTRAARTRHATRIESCRSRVRAGNGQRFARAPPGQPAADAVECASISRKPVRHRVPRILPLTPPATSLTAPGLSHPLVISAAHKTSSLPTGGISCLASVHVCAAPQWRSRSSR